MKKISKMFALGVTCLVSLTGCDLEGKKAFQNIENAMLQKAINDNCFGNASNDLSLSFTAYKIDENNELTKNIDLHAKVQSKNGYSSFLNMYYSNVPNTYFDIKEKSLSDTAKLYKAFEKIVISDLPYIFSNYQVNSFDSLDETFKKFVPNVNSENHYFDHLTICSLSNYNYDNTKMCASFDVNLMSFYKYEYTWLMLVATGGVIPITENLYDEEKQSYTASYFVDAEEYEANRQDSKYLIEKFQQYVDENQTDKYVVTSPKNNNIIAKKSAKSELEHM